MREGDDTFRGRRGTVLDDIRKLNEIGDFLIQPMLVRNWNNRVERETKFLRLLPFSHDLPRSISIIRSYRVSRAVSLELVHLRRCGQEGGGTRRRVREREAKV